MLHAHPKFAWGDAGNVLFDLIKRPLKITEFAPLQSTLGQSRNAPRLSPSHFTRPLDKMLSLGENPCICLSEPFRAHPLPAPDLACCAAGAEAALTVLRATFRSGMTRRTEEQLLFASATTAPTFTSEPWNMGCLSQTIRQNQLSTLPGLRSGSNEPIHGGSISSCPHHHLW